MTAGLAMPTALRTRLRVLRRRLERERAFRIEQLSQFDSAPREIAGAVHRAQHEVEEMVAAAATAALNDIEIALLRMDIGSYGRCQTCHEDMPADLLEAIPQARLCLGCQHIDTRRDSRHDEPAYRRHGRRVGTAPRTRRQAAGSGRLQRQAART